MQIAQQTPQKIIYSTNQLATATTKVKNQGQQGTQFYTQQTKQSSPSILTTNQQQRPVINQFNPLSPQRSSISQNQPFMSGTVIQYSNQQQNNNINSSRVSTQPVVRYSSHTTVQNQPSYNTQPVAKQSQQQQQQQINGNNFTTSSTYIRGKQHTQPAKTLQPQTTLHNNHHTSTTIIKQSDQKLSSNIPIKTTLAHTNGQQQNVQKYIVGNSRVVTTQENTYLQPQQSLQDSQQLLSQSRRNRPKIISHSSVQEETEVRSAQNSFKSFSSGTYQNTEGHEDYVCPDEKYFSKTNVVQYKSPTSGNNNNNSNDKIVVNKLFEGNQQVNQMSSAMNSYNNSEKKELFRTYSQVLVGTQSKESEDSNLQNSFKKKTQPTTQNVQYNESINIYQLKTHQQPQKQQQLQVNQIPQTQTTIKYSDQSQEQQQSQSNNQLKRPNSTTTATEEQNSPYKTIKEHLQNKNHPSSKITIICTTSTQQIDEESAKNKIQTAIKMSKEDFQQETVKRQAKNPENTEEKKENSNTTTTTIRYHAVTKPADQSDYISRIRQYSQGQNNNVQQIEKQSSEQDQNTNKQVQYKGFQSYRNSPHQERIYSQTDDNSQKVIEKQGSKKVIYYRKDQQSEINQNNNEKKQKKTQEENIQEIDKQAKKMIEQLDNIKQHNQFKEKSSENEKALSIANKYATDQNLKISQEQPEQQSEQQENLKIPLQSESQNDLDRPDLTKEQIRFIKNEQHNSSASPMERFNNGYSRLNSHHQQQQQAARALAGQALRKFNSNDTRFRGTGGDKEASKRFLRAVSPQAYTYVSDQFKSKDDKTFSNLNLNLESEGNDQVGQKIDGLPSNFKFVKVVYKDVTPAHFAQKAIFGEPQTPSDQFSGYVNQSNQDQKGQFSNNISEPQAQKWTLKNFQVAKSLGKGIFGKVYLAREKESHMLMALKVMEKKKIQQMQLVEQIAKEIKIHSVLEHPNIVECYGYFDTKSQIILALEYCCGGNLFELLYQQQNKQFDETTAAHFINQIILAIQYLHNKGIIHRDIKPENILIHDDVVKLSDFGIASFNNGRRQTFCGTLEYVSPEIIERQLYDVNVDIWAIGVLAYEICNGEPPFMGTQQKQTIQNVKFHIPRHFSHELSDFVRKILVKNPQQRMTLEQALQHPWITINKQLYDKKHQKEQDLILKNINLFK